MVAVCGVRCDVCGVWGGASGGFLLRWWLVDLGILLEDNGSSDVIRLEYDDGANSGGTRHEKKGQGRKEI